MNRLSTFQTLSLRTPHYTCFVCVCISEKKQKEAIYRRLVPVTLDFIHL